MHHEHDRLCKLGFEGPFGPEHQFLQVGGVLEGLRLQK